MKAEELRIGNLIFWDIPEKLNTIHEVIGIRNKKPQTIPISLGESIEDYKPIPLTEEWLEMFGAEKISASLYDFDGYEFGYFSFTEDGLIIVFQSQQLCEPIKYIHQLQNLYFALTNTELTIKTK